MRNDKKKSMAWPVVLVLLGVVALYAGTSWLALLIPAAGWCGTEPCPRLRSGRN